MWLENQFMMLTWLPITFVSPACLDSSNCLARGASRDLYGAQVKKRSRAKNVKGGQYGTLYNISKYAHTPYTSAVQVDRLRGLLNSP